MKTIKVKQETIQNTYSTWTQENSEETKMIISSRQKLKRQ